MALFKFVDYSSDLSSAPEWKIGDPWDQHYGASVGGDGRDSQIEDYLNADAEKRPFTAVARQNGANLGTTIIVCEYTISTKLTANIKLTITSAGTIGTSFTVRPTGLPAPKLTLMTVMGTFRYFGAITVMGVCDFDGFDFHFTKGGQSTDYLGIDPNYAAQIGDVVELTIIYEPVEATT